MSEDQDPPPPEASEEEAEAPESAGAHDHRRRSRPSEEEEAEAAAEVLALAVAALGGEDRPGQQELCAAVAAAFATGHHLVAEAPTGSGKSLAYLAPAAVAGRRVVIATATLTLQDQLWSKDIPHLQTHGGAPFTAALLKGRSQYVCRTKLRAALDGRPLFDERPGPTFTRDLERLEAFARTSDTGDFAAVDIADASRRAASCAPRECPGRGKCADGEECFAEWARDRAAKADVLVVNHALYCAHLASGGNVLPEHDVVVFDEAHGLADVATDAFGLDLAPLGLRQLATRLSGVGVSRSDTDPIAAAADALERALDGAEGRLDPTRGALADALGSAAEHLATAIPRIEPGPDPAAAAQTTQLATARLEALRRAQAPRVGDVVWQEHGSLCLSPVSVADTLADRLFTRVPTVLCSATLGAGNRFAPLTERLGLDPATDPGPLPLDPDADHEFGDEPGDRPRPGRGYAALRVDSPFDFRSQALLYVARHLPEPRDPAWPDAATAEIHRLVDAAGGRSLVLCTSRAAVTRIADALRDTDHLILVQGDSSKAALLERFATEEASVLVATRSFWMGVDVPGPTCVLVVIDRLPFARPDDPLSEARRETVEREGGNGFRDVDLPGAALVLAQGVGRLIRSRSDRGVVAVLDRRLATAGYRDVLLDALPPMRRVVDADVVRAFLVEVTAPPR
ncbi:MAG: ATP-dependent DNA helicase [Actinobacteria bacterium]|nr:ATP-dependent DNA helicase [Actinomycetota bacterium]